MLKPIKYYFALASQKFLLIEEPLEEILRERIQYYKSSKKNLDFWLLPNPDFLNLPDLQYVKLLSPEKNIGIVSTNPVFVTWLKLRLNNITIGEFEGPSSDLPSPLGYKKILSNTENKKK
jgi:hypothetical protein